MKYSFGVGNLKDKDFKKIFELDKRNYDKKYLISTEETKKRFNKNSNIYFSIRDIKERLVGYISVIPLKHKAYIRLKNGEIDKEVITIEDIISPDEEITDLYFDSIIIDSKYRKGGLGRKFSFYVFEQLPKLYPEYKRILGNTVSEGGLKVLERRGLYKIEKENNSLIIVEKVIKNKSYVKIKNYKDKDKRIIERKREKLFNTNKMEIL
ncbi:GNAT family N-acetyltransferase [Clostridium sp.]|uniref:GNAT family N-acetyltransferase n=1 Tax=Clostridium sp. TaxID=1506 RepID=UPI00262B546D|nr:GNAT family N-acetyltransferase [Clostridium sp.]